MKFIEFRIKNFKGIQDVTINLEKSPKANIYTLVGLNESGKTTILESIDTFDPSMDPLTTPQKRGLDPDNFIPMRFRSNFSDDVYIEAQLSLDSSDRSQINNFAKSKTKFDRIRPVRTLGYYKHYKYKNSNYGYLESLWDGFFGHLKGELTKKFIDIGGKLYDDDNIKLANFCDKLIPSILYFPNFLFDFPSRIYLETKGNPTEAEKLYIDLVQDILYSVDDSLKLQTHLIDRIKSSIPNDKKSLKVLIQNMERKITSVVFGAWSEIFKRSVRDQTIKIEFGKGRNNRTYLELNIEANDGVYNISDRSLGFRWFFTFLLFTRFRVFRKDAPKSVIFLFDEPASNLHPNAQRQLLKSFQNLGPDVKIIYATHSHYLVNPDWLDSTYVVTNSGIDPDTPEVDSPKETDIRISPYREFISEHPSRVDYIQPILDVLDYTPGDLERVPNCTFLEGKNDFYTLKYFHDVIFDDSRELHLTPGTSSNSLDTLIQLYFAWGKEFMILLDADKSGIEQKARYINNFGRDVERRIFLLDDINKAWKGKEIEDLFNGSEKLKFQQTCFPEDKKYNKTHFNRCIQEKLVTKLAFEFSDETRGNMHTVIDFVLKNIENFKTTK